MLRNYKRVCVFGYKNRHYTTICEIAGKQFGT